MKVGTVKLIRDFFAPVTLDEMRNLTPKDRQELASGIARSRGLTQEDCEFELVQY